MDFDFAGFWEDIKRNFGETFSLDFVRAQVAKLRNVGLDFDATYKKLESYRNITAQDPIGNQGYYTLLRDGDVVRNQIRKAVDSVQSVANWVKENLGIGLNDLGALPLIPVAVAGAIVLAVAAATNWITSAKREIARLDAAKAALASGNAALASEIIASGQQEVDQSITGNISSTAKWVAIAAIAIFLLPKLMEKR